MSEFTLEEDPFAVEMSYDLPRSGSVHEVWRSELDSFYAQMRKFESMHVQDVFMCLSAFSARAAEIRTQLCRDDSRKALSFRTKEVEPFLNDCEFQFKVHSRNQSVREMEFKLSGGAI